MMAFWNKNQGGSEITFSEAISKKENAKSDHIVNHSHQLQSQTPWMIKNKQRKSENWKHWIFHLKKKKSTSSVLNSIDKLEEV